MILDLQKEYWKTINEIKYLKFENYCLKIEIKKLKEKDNPVYMMMK